MKKDAPVGVPESNHTHHGALRPSGRNNPCPVCGRTKDSDCRIRSDRELVICHHPRVGLNPGELENGWQFVRNTTDDRGGVFVSIAATASNRVVPTRQIGQTIYEYSPTQRIIRVPPRDGKAKEFRAQHLDSSAGKWIWKQGDSAWPIYRHQQVIEALDKGEWLLFEFEGEKCTDIAAAGGVVAFSQPGHAHTLEQVTTRYKHLLGAGAGLVVYVADHDVEGQKRAQTAIEAAAAAGLQLTVVHANDIWGGMPLGGSIDDVPGGPAVRVAAIYGAVDLTPTWAQRKALAVRGLKDPLAVHDALWALLREQAQGILQSDRPILEQRQAVKAVATDLGLKLSSAEVEALYEQIDSTLSIYEPPVEPGDEFEALSQQWLLAGLVLLGLNLLVGMPGAGKSRLLIALIRAFLAGQQTFLQRALMDGRDKSVLIVGTDQDRQQWGALLAEQGLTSITNTSEVDGIERNRYRLHPKITLHTSGGGFKLDPDGMRYIRDWCQANPGGLLIIDSLSAVLPPGVSECDATAGRLMRQIEVARQGNPCIITHHCNKQSAMAGEIGVYSGSGHGSVDRAVSRHIGLGYDIHTEGGKEKLHTESPRRIITSQKRGALNQRIVVEMGSNGSWDYIATAAEERELQRQERDGDPTERLKGWKLAIYKVLSEEWCCTSEVTARLEEAYASKPNAHKQVQHNLRELSDHGVIEEDRSSIGEARWRVRPA